MIDTLRWLYENWTWLVPLVAFVAIMIGTFSIWWPWWQLLPTPVKTAIVAAVGALIAYKAGQSSGASTANAKAQAKDQANADKVRAAGARARAAARNAGDVRAPDSDERKGG